MTKFSTAIKLLKNNKWEFIAKILCFFSFIFSDRIYLILMFWCRMGYWPNINKPKSYSEKLLWLKINDRNPLYTRLVDKYEVKDYVRNLIGEKHLAKTLGVWSRPEEIIFDELPMRFVLKTTHGGGNTGVIICRDKRYLDISETVKKLKSSMKQDLYKDSREWPYKNVKKRIIAEEFLEDLTSSDLIDYKFFCFNGSVKALFVATERQSRDEPYFNFFDENYCNIDLQQGHPVSPIVPDKPSCFEEMIKISELLSENLPHVRVDLYEVNGVVYFGELTFYHFGGMVPFNPRSWDYKWGEWLKLPKNN